MEKSRHLMDRIEFESIWLFGPCFADGFVGCEAFEGPAEMARTSPPSTAATAQMNSVAMIRLPNFPRVDSAFLSVGGSRHPQPLRAAAARRPRGRVVTIWLVRDQRVGGEDQAGNRSGVTERDNADLRRIDHAGSE
jgi:hypothetical protein